MILSTELRNNTLEILFAFVVNKAELAVEDNIRKLVAADGVVEYFD